MTYFGRSPNMITLHTGPSGNKYCKITTYGNKPRNYDIDAIKRGSRDTPEQRRDLLLQIIARSPGILHTHVIKIAYELGYLAKKTIENELERMEDDEILESEKNDERQNSSRRWFMWSPKSDIEKEAIKQAINIVKLSDQYVSKIERAYHKFNPARKAWAITHLLQVLHHFQPTMEIINQEYRIKKEMKQFDTILNRAYDILLNEDRDYVDGRPILRRLLQLRTSKPYIEMENFLKEIKH